MARKLGLRKGPIDLVMAGAGIGRFIWPETTVATRDKYTGKLTIDGVEVIYDPVDHVYIPRENPVDDKKTVYIV